MVAKMAERSDRMTVGMLVDQRAVVLAVRWVEQLDELMVEWMVDQKAEH